MDLLSLLNQYFFIAILIGITSSYKSYAKKNTLKKYAASDEIGTVYDHFSSDGWIAKKQSQKNIKQKLTVEIRKNLKSFEHLALTGNVKSLGNWKAVNSILMHRTVIENNLEIWSVDILVPLGEEIQYRYFIAELDSENKTIIVQEWETHMEPRILSNYSNNDQYGIVKGEINTDKGWLSNGESIVQFKFYRNPFKCDYLTNLTDIGIKIIPFKSEYLNADNALDFKQVDQPSTEVKIETTKIAYNNSNLKLQSDEGEIYKFNDILIFHITVRDLKRTGYLLHLSVYEEYKMPLGYQFILPSDLEGSEGLVEVPVISHLEQRSIGFMEVRYLIIKPTPKGKSFTMKTTFTNYWRKNWTRLDFGHRGLGVSFRLPTNAQPPIIENTLASMKQAVLEGVDGVEFDVQLTKDLIPIIYHDFLVKVSRNSVKPSSPEDLIEVLIKDLTYEQLKRLKIYQVTNQSEIVEYLSHYEERREDYRLFPLFEDFLTKIDKSIGFDIEIKWPQKYLNGGVESVQTLDKNIFVDKILETIFNKGCGRLTFISSFDADICTMIKFKQNLYPTMFLVSKEMKRNDSYEDPRCSSIENAASNAQAWNLRGVVPNAEDFFKEPSLVQLVTDLDQVVFTWGDDANSTQSVKRLKEVGLTGVIYNRVDKFCEKKESIFKTEEYKKLFHRQCFV